MPPTNRILDVLYIAKRQGNLHQLRNRINSLMAWSNKLKRSHLKKDKSQTASIVCRKYVKTLEIFNANMKCCRFPIVVIYNNTFSHSYIRYLYIENSSLYTICVYISNFKYTVYVYLMYLIHDADIDIIFNFYTFKLIIIVQNKSG